jgi:hypothetical protein
LFGKGRHHPGSPRRGRLSDHRDLSFADRRRHDEGDERLVLVVYNSGVDLAELRLENALNGLHFNAMPPHFELRVEAAKEVYALCLNVDFAFIAGAVEAAKLGMRDELFGCELRQVAVSAREVPASDTELSNLSVR